VHITASLSPVVKYHGLASRHVTRPRFLMRPQLNGGTLGGRRGGGSHMIQERMVSLRREALLANDRSPESTVLSSQGGVPLGLPGESWPSINGELLFPILTVATRELPVIPTTW
jgi:hypothetical protein